MIQTAKKYYQSGLSIIPIGEKKLPIGSWKKNQTELIEPAFTSCIGIGIVCGKVSGGVECIDIDSKYDLTGNLFDNYKNLINEIDKDLLKKLVVQSTPSGGYHFVYRCETIEGNKKLANRHTTEAEKAENPKDKIRVLIETRGEGGYFMVAPSNGYKVIYGDLNQISILSALERETLLACAKSLNEVFEFVKPNKTYLKVLSENVSPLDEWNKRGDVLTLLENEGWVVTFNMGAKYYLLRPAGDGTHSSDWNEEMRIFYVWTSSTEFQPNKGYNASQVLAKLRFNDDFSECAKWLLKEGYGSFTPDNKQRKEPEYLNKTEINIEDDNFDFLATKEDCDTFINQKIDGTFKIADSTGFDKLDEYWRFKDASLDMVLGHDNTGKSVFSCCT